jgi:hypothetical protein
MLDPGEHADLTVDLPAASRVHPGNPLNLVVKLAGGTVLVIQDALSD